jgi:hypothetical protein
MGDGAEINHSLINFEGYFSHQKEAQSGNLERLQHCDQYATIYLRLCLRQDLVRIQIFPQ